MYLNDKLWKISYLLEFKINNIVTDAFAFSVPVQSEDYTFPQRIAETKTFGGVVIDDYGNDTVTINLSGTTINQDLKIIYKGEQGFDYMTGKEEIFYLQKLIEEYGEPNKLKNKEVMLYELSGGGKSGQGLRQWRIFITNFQIKRSKEKPFCYDYTLQAKSVEQTKSSYVKGTVFYDDFRSKFEKTIKTLNEWIEAAEGFAKDIFSAIDTYKSCLADIQHVVQDITGYVGRYEALVTTTIDQITDAIVETQEIANTVVLESLRLTPQYIAMDVLSSCSDLVVAADNLVLWWQDFKGGSKYKQIEDSYEGVKSELQDNLSVFFAHLKTNSEEVASLTSQEISDVSFVVVPDKNDSIVKSYGFMQKTYRDADTWESLSFESYGTAEMAQMLALFNGRTDIESGDIVNIPILDESKSNEDNEVVRQYGEYDNIGKDLMIKDGDFVIKNGDLYISEDVDTLDQAIESRLSTALNSRIRNVVYGIRTSVGDSTDVSSAYVMESIRQTILADPRIERIDKLQWEGVGDGIAIDIIYTIEGGIQKKYKGKIS